MTVEPNWVVKIKVITPGKIVPYKCCLPSWNISMKKGFNTDVLFDVITHFSGTLLNMNKM